MAIRGWIWRALIVALLLLMMALYLIADHIEQRDEVQLSEQKRDLNTQFEARVDQRAHEIAAFAIEQHDEAREAAQAIIDQKSGDPDVRATVGALFDGTRGDLLTVWQILKNTDPRTSILVRLPLTLEPKQIALLYQSVARAGYIRGDWWKTPPTRLYRP